MFVHFNEELQRMAKALFYGYSHENNIQYSKESMLKRQRK